MYIFFLTINLNYIYFNEKKNNNFYNLIYKKYNDGWDFINCYYFVLFNILSIYQHFYCWRFVPHPIIKYTVLFNYMDVYRQQNISFNIILNIQTFECSWL